MGKNKCGFCNGTGQMIEPDGKDGFKTVSCPGCGGSGQG